MLGVSSEYSDSMSNRQNPKGRRDDLIQVEIDSINGDGVGVGRFKSRTVFVPYTIPGEIVSARPIKTNETSIQARGVTLIDASADRVLPRCPHFGVGRCGGCDWQHIDPAVQALIKQDVLTEQLERGGLRNPPVQAIIPAPHAWGYHYHMTFIVADRATGKAPNPPSDTRANQPQRGASTPPLQDGEGEISSELEETDIEAMSPENPNLYLGFASADDDGRIIPIEECHILHPELLDLFQQLDLDLSNLRRVKMQIGTDGAMMLILTAMTDQAPEIRTDLPVSINLILPDNEPMNLIGDSHSFYQIGARLFRVTAGSYMRSNVAQIPALVDAVINLLDVQPDESVLDLFAGVGVFSAFLAPRDDWVTMIESYPPAVTDADENLGDLDNVDVIEGGVDDVLETLEERYHAAVIDPPSRGISDGAIQSLVELGVQRIVYVANEPALFAREAKKLIKAGYQLRAIQPIDSAPQTVFVELAALLVRTDQ